MIKKLGLSILTLAILVSCASQKQLIKNVSNEQVAKDNAECKNEGLKQMRITTFDNMMIEADKNNQVSTNCLLAKGYTWQEKPTDEQLAKRKEVNDRYVAAFAESKEKGKKMSQYVVDVCRPKPDAEYIACLNENTNESIAISVFPEMTKKFFSERKEYEQQLIRKEITRKEFKDAVTKIESDSDKKIMDCVNRDIANGVYTGKC